MAYETGRGEEEMEEEAGGGVRRRIPRISAALGREGGKEEAP